MIQRLGKEGAARLIYDWKFWARPSQLPPEGQWRVWMKRAGRRSGKTRTAVEWIRTREAQGYKRFAFVAKTPFDYRTIMIEGESGILAKSPPWNMPVWEPTKRKLTWPSGTEAVCFSGAEPDQLRGPTFDTAWVDELAAFKYPSETWSNLQFMMSFGDDPRTIVTTTPKPLRLLKEIEVKNTTYVGEIESTYDNQMNLAPSFLEDIISPYEGTRTGRQEIYAQLLDQAEFALWNRQWIDVHRILSPATYPDDMRRVVVAIDPATTAEKESDETGIIVAGVRDPQEWYVLEDCSGRYSPNGWATRAIQAMNKWSADRIVAERNQGGDMVESTLRNVSSSIPYGSVWAGQGKRVRAEPIAALYEQGKVHHVGVFSELEDQLCSWEAVSGQKSPDRLDALVWALAELQGSGMGIYL